MNPEIKSDLGDIISRKSFLISSLYEFAKLFEKFRYLDIYRETINQTISHIKKLYDFNEGVFINFDNEKDNLYIRGDEIAYKMYETIPFESDEMLEFAKKSKTITFKIFNNHINLQLYLILLEDLFLLQ